MTRNEKLSLIEKNKTVINQMRTIESEVLKRYLEDSGIVYTHNSTAIEGNTMTLNETWAVIKENAVISGKTLAEHLEILGHKEALDFVADAVSNQTALTESLIKQIHALVLLDKDRTHRGVYRNVPVRVGSHIPPQPFEVPVKMEQYVADYNQSNLSPIEKEAKFHLEFETIHPFIDGNGRTGRLLVNFGLMKSGYPVMDIAYSDRQAYYDCFTEYRAKNSHGKMYDLFVDKTLESTNNWVKTFSSYI